jgi:hypothetical protein
MAAAIALKKFDQKGESSAHPQKLSHQATTTERNWHLRPSRRDADAELPEELGDRFRSLVETSSKRHVRA